MPPVAHKGGADSVFSPNGTGKNCPNPLTTATAAGSSRVFADGIGVVRGGDAVQSHTHSGCGSEAPGLSVQSTRVFCDSKTGIGRIGDIYGNNVITSGSSRVFAN